MTEPDVPVARVTTRRRFSPVWLTPLVAIALLVYLAVNAFARRGPVITIGFATADGISAGQTQVKHRDVALGTVDDVRLADDLSHVIVRIRMDRKAAPLLTDHARFWVVRPRLSPENIGAALETLVSGAHIEIDPGAPGGHPQRAFEALRHPPGVTSDQPGRTFVLEARDLGSLGTGAPVLYRGVTAGEVLGYKLPDPDGPFEVRVFVAAPYDAFVRERTRFWQEAGVTLGSGPRGIQLDVAPLPTLLTGGVAFETPAHDGGATSAEGARFSLYPSQPEADAATFASRVACVAYFAAPAEGLGRGSPVQLFGFTVGEVRDARLVADHGAPHGLMVRVDFDVQPHRLTDDGASEALRPEGLRSLVDEGARVTVASRSFVTGEKALALAFVPGAKPASVRVEDGALVMPSVSGGGDVAGAIRDVAAKLDRIPFDEIGRNLRATLRSVERTVGGPEARDALRALSSALDSVQHLAKEADAGLGPALQRIPDVSDQLQQAAHRVNEVLGHDGYGEDSEFQRGAQLLLRQMNETARAVRLLADFLDRHPESILRGRSEGAR